MKDSFLDKLYYVILREGRRRQIAEDNDISYTPKTDWELVDEVFSEQEGWEDVLKPKDDG